MANTYTKIYLHIVFAVKNRNSLIPAVFQPRIHSFIATMLQQNKHAVYAIGGIDSHVHMLVSYNINQSIPDMVRNIKSATSRFINEQHFIPFKFEWQSGYGCFSYSESQVESVKNYIRNQPEHHKGITLQQEMQDMLEKFRLDYDCRYIIKDPS